MPHVESATPARRLPEISVVQSADADLVAEYTAPPSPVAHRIVAVLDAIDRREARVRRVMMRALRARWPRRQRTPRRARAARRAAVRATAPPAPEPPPQRSTDRSRLIARGAS
jgi:hypothetical protein